MARPSRPLVSWYGDSWLVGYELEARYHPEVALITRDDRIPVLQGTSTDEEVIERNGNSLDAVSA
jgi:hypothetical protein